MVMVRTEEINITAPPGVAKVVASCFALSAFAIAMLAGMFGGNDAITVLVRALLAVMVCYPVGYLAGVLADIVIREQISAESRASAAETTGTDADESSTPPEDQLQGRQVVPDG